ncbi:P-loop NTPase fold protein [Streptomyces spongiae]|nr:P-loop NTPase fold protein [Streptomyces spongiae]
MGRRQRVPFAGTPDGIHPPLLRSVTDEALASPEIQEALLRSRIAPDEARNAVLNSEPELFGQAAPGYHDYVGATARRVEALAKADMLTLGTVGFLVVYAIVKHNSLLTSPQWLLVAVMALFLATRLRRTRTPLVRRATEQARGAGQRWRDSLRDDAVLPFLRAWITEATRSDLFSTQLDPRTAPGLIERSEPKHLVATAAMTDVAQITGTTAAGSIGVSGPRGSGKTTLIKSFCARDYQQTSSVPELRVMLSAPVNYQGHAFIVHLFVQLCHAVLRSQAAQTDIPFWRGFDVRRLVRLFVGVSLCLLGVTALWETLSAPAGRSLSLDSTLLIGICVLGLSGIAGGLVLLSSHARPPTADITPRVTASMAERTRQQLRRLQFVRTSSTVSTAVVKISAPLGADLGGTYSDQLAENQLTLPELVEQYQDYAAEVAHWWRAHHGGTGRLFIGIDEVDRIVEPDGAQQFLNEVKAVFDVPHCFYLVSISEEALAAFERRAVATRTTFDTAFDEVVRVDYLGYEASVALLSRRVAGLPRPFIALCHSFSGGLPRELVRSARTIVEFSQQGADGSVRSLARALVTEEIQTLKRGHLTRVSGRNPRQADSLTMRLYDPAWPEATPEGLLRAAGTELAWGAQLSGDDILDLLALELASVFCFHATLLEIFEDPRLPDRLRDPESTEAGFVNQLARVRSLMPANRPLSMQLINQLRRDEGLREIAIV